ncbi:MAG: DUF342 domain-containing protein, partial [Firmicutes bacterium]|nr:DUF342 domain-containing protein [Bacillota bacterium]
MEQGKDEKKQCMAGVSSGRVIISGSAEETDGDGVEITAGEGVLLQVNGQTVDGSRRVCARDEIEIAPLQLQMPARIEVKIAKDEMEAQAVYFAPREIHYVIPDHPPAAELVISASKTEVEAAPGAGFSPVDIRNTLQAQGVVYGLDEAALSGLISKPGEWRVIATGHPPVQGRDGYVEPLFKEGLQQINYDLTETHVDYRKRYEIPQVEKDQVIARIYPPRSGEPGMTVTGVKIPPEPVYPAEMFLETGTALNDAQNEVVALGSGVPVYRVRGKQVIVKVDNIYTHRGDVDVLSGHINFEGHLRIEGGIGEGLCVKAEGDIEIADNGSGAEIIAGGSIVFKKNCIKCLVRAGEQT